MVLCNQTVFQHDSTVVFVPCRFPVVLSPVEEGEEGAVNHPLFALTVISQPGLARGHTYYPIISFQIAKTLQVVLYIQQFCKSKSCQKLGSYKSHTLVTMHFSVPVHRCLDRSIM